MPDPDWMGYSPFAKEVIERLTRLESKVDAFQYYDTRITGLEASQSRLRGAAWAIGIIGSILAVVIPFKSSFMSIFQ